MVQEIGDMLCVQGPPYTIVRVTQAEERDVMWLYTLYAPRRNLVCRFMDAKPRVQWSELNEAAAVLGWNRDCAGIEPMILLSEMEACLEDWHCHVPSARVDGLVLVIRNVQVVERDVAVKLGRMGVRLGVVYARPIRDGHQFFQRNAMPFHLVLEMEGLQGAQSLAAAIGEHAIVWEEALNIRA